jgi:hypothetical protein
MAAEGAERNAKYMLWSVRVAAMAAIFSAVPAIAWAIATVSPFVQRR